MIKILYIFADSGYVSKNFYEEYKKDKIIILAKQKKNVKNNYYNNHELDMLKKQYMERQKIEHFFKFIKEDLNCKNLYLSRNITSFFNKILFHILISQLLIKYNF